MDSSRTIQFIKCLNRTDLIKYLKEEKYTTVADILRTRDIDGIRFLDLSELDLIQWRLNPRQKKIILECRDKLLEKKTPHKTINKPAVAKKPDQLLRSRTNSTAKIAELQSKLQLEKIPCNAPKILKTNSENLNKSKKDNIVDQYIDMTQGDLPAPSRPVKNNNGSKIISVSNIKPNEDTNHLNMMQNTQKNVVKSVSLKNFSEFKKPSNNNYIKGQRSLPTPPQLHNLGLTIKNKGFNRTIQDDETYEHPDNILQYPKPHQIIHNKSIEEDQDVYQDSENQKTLTTPALMQYKKLYNQSFIHNIKRLNKNLVDNEDSYEDPNVIENASKRSFTNFSQNKTKFKEPLQDDIDYEDPKDIPKDENITQNNKCLNKQDNEETYEDPEEIKKPMPLMLQKPQQQFPIIFSQNNTDDIHKKQINKIPRDSKIMSQPKRVNFFQNKNNLKNSCEEDLYEDPEVLTSATMALTEISIIGHQSLKKTNRTIHSDDENYEDPDFLKEHLFSKGIKENSEPDYELPSEKQQVVITHNQKKSDNGVFPRPLPPLPPKCITESRTPAVPSKLREVDFKRSENDFNGGNELHSRDKAFSDCLYKKDSVLRPVHCGYDNYRLSKKSNPSLMERNEWDVNKPSASASNQILHNVCWDENQLPAPPPELLKPLLSKEKGDIWNSFDQSNLPSPQQFKHKFKHAESAYMKMYVEAEEKLANSSKNYNLNDFPFFRNTDRKGARLLLTKIKNIQNGAFLIRKSNEFYLVITMYYQNRFYNVGIDKNDDGTIYCKTSDDKAPKSFNTLYQFVEYYKTRPLTMKTKGIEINIYLNEQLTSDIF